MRKQRLGSNDEGGFILVTAIILLAILMGLGAAAMFKSRVQIKVSASAADSAKAFAAAQAGLDYVYHGWSRGTVAQKQEFSDIVAATTSAGAAPTILINKAPSAIADLGATAALVDTWVQGSGARVYNLTNAGITPAASAAQWNVDKYAQVAVWVTRFQKPTVAKAYPYDTYSSAACANCTAVTYTLGRAGNAYKLLREYSSVSKNNVQAFGALMNAPRYKNDTVGCAVPVPAPSTTVSFLDGVASTSAITTSHLIDATQAPGGIAIASNNGVNFNAGKQFYGKTGSSFRDIDPFVIYDPGKVAATAATYPAVAGDKMSIATATVSSGRFDPYSADPYMNIFNSDSDQLFQLNAYREAANRISGFKNEKLVGTFPGGVTSYIVDSSGTTLGNYDALTPTMGTMNWVDVLANVAASRPMYGLVRFMIPVTSSGGAGTCSAMMFAGSGSFASEDLGGTGKLIVYGGALFDFFYDVNGNGLYDPLPGGGDRLLTPLEAAQNSFKMNVNIPLLFNPVMTTPARTGGLPRSNFVGEAILDIYAYPNGSPSWDKASDADVGNGVMDYIQDVYDVAKAWSTKVYGAGTLQFTNYATWITNKKPVALGGGQYANNPAGVTRETEMLEMLDYYIRTTAEGTKTNWSDRTLGNIETNRATFRIKTTSDLQDSASSADLYHTFLPSGYIHGWKRAMVETGLARQSGATGKSIWNEDLIGNNPGSVSPYYATKNKYFNLTGYVDPADLTKKAKVDKNFADVPAEMYAGGLVDMHQIVNTSGVIYTPGQLELEQKTQNGFQALQYINGIIISGHGTYMKQESAPNALTIIAYDDTSIDTLPSNQASTTLGRKYWQELK